MLVFVMPVFLASGQVNVRDSAIYTPIIYAAYSINMLGGDIADMYGASSTLGAGIGYKTKKNVYYSFEYNYLWGGNVKQGDEILQYILTQDGQLIGQSGEYAIFQYFLRGHTVWGRVGKLFPVLSPNPNSGILLQGGGGWVQHRMFVSVQDNTALQLKDDYKKGYDRLHSGFGLTQSIGYLFLGDSRMWNFYAGFEFSQAWTKNQRDVNFDTRVKDDTQKLDLFYGFKIGWVIPMYRRAPVGYYY
ncbi:MAG: hypothetical protein DRJ15_02500 [Bacteroidetes bacterium]|nr:MAG: hypothetical protein DRJ15_02500 [Bacteroidota bacterium]